MCRISVESIVMIHNETKIWDWFNNSIDCLLYCQIGDKISAVVLNTQIYNYSYTIFSGYMLFNL